MHYINLRIIPSEMYFGSCTRKRLAKRLLLEVKAFEVSAVDKPSPPRTHHSPAENVQW